MCCAWDCAVGVETVIGNCCQRTAAVPKRAHIDTRTAMKLREMKSHSDGT